MNSILQAGWFINPISRPLPVLILAVGIQILFSGLAFQYIRRTDLFQNSRRGRLIATFSMGLGLLFACLSLLQTSYGIYATYLFLLFNLIEGAAVIEFYQRVLTLITTGSISQFFSGSRMKYRLGSFFVVIISGMILFDVIEITQYTGWERVRFSYTVFIIGLTAFGVRWRLRAVDDRFNTAVIYGLVLCIVGAELYDYVLTEEIVVSVLGTIAFSSGFWIAAFGWLTRKRS